MACIELYATGQNYHIEKQGFGYPWLSKNIQTHQPKPAEAEPSFRKVSLPPANNACFSLLNSGLGSFGHKSTLANFS